MTIDGVPLRTSATKRLTVESRLPGNSEAKTPAPIPTGIPMRQAVPTMSIVPTIAFATPPPLSPAGTGIFVKKSSDRLPAPLSSSVPRMNRSGRTASSTQAMSTTVMVLLFTRRNRRRFIARSCRRPTRGRLAR